ncbi:LysR family transcriptional regulator [Halomonas organivorans]
MPMDVRSLRYFLAAYEGGSISAAARRCHVAQPSISQALAQLEARLDAVLFERHRRGITPTEEGRRLYPLACRVCDDMGAITRLFRQPQAPTPVRLGLKRSLGAERMSSLLKDYAARGDNLALTLVNPGETCDARIIGEQDLSPEEAFQPIWHDRYLLALPAGHPLGRETRVALEALDGLPMIWRFPCAGMERLAESLASAGVRCQVRARLRTIEYTLGLVAAGVGASLVPAWPEVLARPDLQCRPLGELEIAEVVGLAWPRRADTTALDALIAPSRERWAAQAG